MSEQRPRHHTFADLTPERRREIASMGAAALHASGKGHRWTSEEAREAGRVGGQRGKPYSRKPRPEKEMETKKEPAALPECN